jgi:hypothetical protein
MTPADIVDLGALGDDFFRNPCRSRSSANSPRAASDNSPHTPVVCPVHLMICEQLKMSSPARAAFGA